MSDEFTTYFPDSGKVDMDDRTTAIDDAVRDELRALAAKYPRPRSALMPMLHLVQSVDGRVSPAGIEACAEILGITSSQVAGVATFYTMFRRSQGGTHNIGICATALCAVMGGDAIYDAVERKLGLDGEGTTADGMFTLERIECNAGCDFAPIMMVNWEYMDNMTPDKAIQILDDLAAGREVKSTRGATITNWRDTERVLAGFPDGRADEGPSAGEPSLLGLRLAGEAGPDADAPRRALPDDADDGPAPDEQPDDGAPAEDDSPADAPAEAAQAADAQPEDAQAADAPAEGAEDADAGDQHPAEGEESK